MRRVMTLGRAAAACAAAAAATAARAGAAGVVRSGSGTGGSRVTHHGRARRVDKFLTLQRAWDQEMQTAARPVAVTIHPPAASQGEQAQGPAQVVVSSHTTVPAQLTRGLPRRSQIAACRVNGQLWDLMRPITAECDLEFLYWDSHWDKGLQEMCWHTGAHVLGAALEEVCGDNIALCDGPALTRGAGFFYEGYLRDGSSLDSDILSAVEAHMRELCRLKHNLQRIDVTPEQALDVFSDNPFKQHFIQRAQAQGSETVSLYKLASFVDLCQGPHLRDLRPFAGGAALALTSTSQSLFDWADREDCKPDDWPTQTPLARTYGVSFPSKAMFRAWKRDMEEREKYNHVAVGKALSIFMQHETSPGSPFFLPHGVRLLQRLKSLLRKQYRIRGYDEVMTPLVFSQRLWETSGHWHHYRDDMFRVMGFDEPEHGSDNTLTERASERGDEDENLRGLKPMNCPAHCLIFGHTKRSHHELPMRLSEFSALHRNEASGALVGLTRVRQFHQDDAHIFCSNEQIQQEVDGCLDFVCTVYDACGFSYALTLSTRPEEFVGDIDTWDRAEQQLHACLQDGGITYDINAGDGAFYGPKIDVYLEDRMGRRHQSATIQLDFQLPQRFDLKYTDSSGGRQTPVIIHRAILGSLERMTAVLLEHTRGHFPLWCSPRQVAVLSVSSAHRSAAQRVCDRLVRADIHAEAFLEDTTIARKVRNAEQLKFNVIIVVGDEEEHTETYTLRWRDHDKRLAPLPEPLQAVLRADRACLASGVQGNTGERQRDGRVASAGGGQATDAKEARFPLEDIVHAIHKRMAGVMAAEQAT